MKTLNFQTPKLIKQNKIKSNIFFFLFTTALTRFEAGVTGSSRDTLEGKWVLDGEICKFGNVHLSPDFQ